MGSLAAVTRAEGGGELLRVGFGLAASFPFAGAEPGLEAILKNQHQKFRKTSIKTSKKKTRRRLANKNNYLIMQIVYLNPQVIYDYAKTFT